MGDRARVEDALFTGMRSAIAQLSITIDPAFSQVVDEAVADIAASPLHDGDESHYAALRKRGEQMVRDGVRTLLTARKPERP